MSERLTLPKQRAALKWWSGRCAEAVLHHLIVLLALWPSQDGLQSDSATLHYTLDAKPILQPHTVPHRKHPV